MTDKNRNRMRRAAGSEREQIRNNKIFLVDDIVAVDFSAGKQCLQLSRIQLELQMKSHSIFVHKIAIAWNIH